MSLAEGATIVRGQSIPQPPPTESASSERLGRTMDPENKADGKSKKRSLFGLGKKKKSFESPDDPSSPAKPTSNPGPSLSRGASKLSSATRSTSPPSQKDFAMTNPSSPSRGMSSSPRLSSPARSQIFERDVQEYTAAPTSPAIPSHIQTENHIPPVLNASSEAITDDHLDPDSVEIVTHSQHQPASVTVTGAPSHQSYDQIAGSWTDELAAYSDRDDASAFTPLDGSTNDIRRLSFISFADVVQSEHSAAAPSNPRESLHLAGLTSFSNLQRSPSPIRSPVSSQGPGTSPPTSKSGSVKGLDMSPSRKPLGSAASTQLGLGTGDVTVETMSQALRRTGSADLGAAKSGPTSPVEGPAR
ncbi:hypothetical protein VUR80DRAFT_6894 [Thermomyces stellatus]